MSSISRAHLRIGDVARLVGMSPSGIRGWEHLGLTHPRRTRNRYRLYTIDDVRLLKKALYLRKVKGLNAPAILQMLSHKRLGLGPKDQSPSIGLRLRHLRAKSGFSLAQVAREVGISVGFLSAIERSQMSASVGTLRRIARFYSTNILEFFDPLHANMGLVHPQDRKVLEAGRGVRMELLASGSSVMEPHLFRIAPQAGSGESYAHEGEEFLFLLRGKLKIFLADKEYYLHSGDSLLFESTIAHHWVNPGTSETWVLWINTPPTF